MPSSGLPPVQDNFEGNSEYRSVDDVGNGDVGEVMIMIMVRMIIQ